MKKKNYPLSKVYGLLEPGPVVLVTTIQKERPDIMAMAWYTMMEFEPPFIGCVISNRNFSFEILKATRECAINIPTVDLADKVVGCGSSSGIKVDKFTKFCLTPVMGTFVHAPLIGECYANLECKVVDTKLVTKYNFFILEVQKAWVDLSIQFPQTIHHQGNGNFVVDGERIKLPFKLK